jgi:hypothetical protein
MYLSISMLFVCVLMVCFCFFCFYVWHGVARIFDLCEVWHAKTECATHSTFTQSFNTQYFSILILSVARWHGGTEKHINLKRKFFFEVKL